MPCCGRPSALVRTRQNIQSAYWPRVFQVFWPLTSSDRLGARRWCAAGEVGARARLRIPLTPPIFGGKDSRQEVLLLCGVGEIHQDRRQHSQRKRVLRRRADVGPLLLENVLLHDVPASRRRSAAATSRRPSLGRAESSASAIKSSLTNALAQLHPGADVGGQSASRKARTSARKASSSAVYFRSTRNFPCSYGTRRRRLRAFRRQPLDRRRQQLLRRRHHDLAARLACPASRSLRRRAPAENAR